MSHQPVPIYQRNQIPIWNYKDKKWEYRLGIELCDNDLGVSICDDDRLPQPVYFEDLGDDIYGWYKLKLRDINNDISEVILHKYSRLYISPQIVRRSSTTTFNWDNNQIVAVKDFIPTYWTCPGLLLSSLQQIRVLSVTEYNKPLSAMMCPNIVGGSLDINCLHVGV